MNTENNNSESEVSENSETPKHPSNFLNSRIVLICSLLTTVVLLTLLLTHSPLSAGSTSNEESAWLVIVNDHVVTEDAFMEWFHKTLAVTFGANLADMDEDMYNTMLEIRYEVLLQYIEFLLLYNNAVELGLAVQEDEVRERIDDFKMFMLQHMDSDELNIMLEEVGLTEDELYNFFAEVTLVSVLYESIRRGIEVSEDDIQSFYDGNPELWDMLAQRQARHILVATQEEADEILELLAEGESFDSLLYRSIDVFTTEQMDGYIDTFDSDGFTIGSGRIDPVFANAAFDMDIGEISMEPVATQFGYHIIYLANILPARIMPLDEARDSIVIYLTQHLEHLAMDDFNYRLFYYANLQTAEGLPFRDDIFRSWYTRDLSGD